MSQATNLRPPFQRRFGAGSIRRFKQSKFGLKKVEKKQVNKMVHRAIKRSAEKKMIDVYYDTPVLQAGAAVDMTAQIVQGHKYTERNGMWIQPLKVRLSFRFAPGAAEDQMVRLIVFRWQIDNAAVPPVTSGLLEDFNAVQALFSPYKHDVRQFQMLYDKVYQLNGTTTGGENQFKNKTVTLFKGLEKKVGYGFNANTGTNHLYFFLITDAASSGPIVRLHYTIQYTDV